MSQPFSRGSQGAQTIAASTSINVLKNTISGVSLGDLIVVHLSYTGNPTPNIPAGWTRRGFQANGVVLGQVFFLKYATLADLDPWSVYTFTFTASTTAAANIVVLGNVDPTMDLTTVDFIQSTGTSTTPTTATFNTTIPDSLILNGVATNVVAAVTPPAGYTELVDIGSTVAAPTTIICEISSKGQAVEGATGALTSSIASSQAWVSGAVAIPGPDYPSLRGATTGSASVTPVATVAKPAGVAVNDLLLIFAELEAGTTFNLECFGFALIDDITSGGTRVVRWGRLATASDLTATTYTVVRSEGTGTLTLHMLAIRNVRSSPFGTSSIVALSSTSTPTTTAITTRLNTPLLIAVFDQVGSNTATPPTGMTERTDSVGMETATQFQASQGTTGTKQATFTGAAVSIAGILEVLSPTAQLVESAWDTNFYWGAPSMYFFAAAAWDTLGYWGPPVDFDALVSSGTTYDVTLTDAATASESSTSTFITSAVLTDAATTTESETVTFAAIGSLTDPVNASESETATYSTNVLITDTVTASEAETSAGVFASSLTESVTASESEIGTFVTPVALTESVTAAESDVSILDATGLLTESGAASESETAGADFISAASESVTGADSSDSTAVLNDSVSETLTATDSQTGGGQAFDADITESLGAVDLLESEIVSVPIPRTTGGGAGEPYPSRYVPRTLPGIKLPRKQPVTHSAKVRERLRATESSSVLSIAVGSLSDSLKARARQKANQTARADVAESISAASLVTSTSDLVGAVTESIAVSDSSSAELVKWILETVEFNGATLNVYRDLSISLDIEKGATVDLVVSKGDPAEIVDLPTFSEILE